MALQKLLDDLNKATTLKETLLIFDKIMKQTEIEQHDKIKSDYAFKLLALENIEIVDFTDIKPNLAEAERLGIDDNGYKEDEGIVADQYQQYYNVTLERFDDGRHKFYVAGKPADFAQVEEDIDPKEWLTIDFMFTEFTFDSERARLSEFDIFEHRRKARKWQNLQDTIQEHIEKADIVPMDLRGMTDKMRVKVLYYVLSLSAEQQKQIVVIR